jgi:Phosphotransferase enzyme family
VFKPAAADQRSLAARLAPRINEACGDQLGPINWFRADWQRGGAATGVATWRDNDGSQVGVVVKLPVVQRELRWMKCLQDGASVEAPDEPAAAGGSVIPRLFASGTSLGDYDMRWIVMERFPYGPLGLHWHDEHVPRICEAAARFHALAQAIPVDQGPVIEPWDQLVHEAIDSVRLNRIAEEHRWTIALKTLLQRVDELVGIWRARDAQHWIHGDLHLANAMSRIGADHGPVCLIDLAEVHAGHWIEDGVYLERQLWARPRRMARHKPVKLLARARRQLGLSVEDDYARLAMIRRALLAGTAPRFIKSEGHPTHLAACLQWLERSLAELG